MNLSAVMDTSSDLNQLSAEPHTQRALQRAADLAGEVFVNNGWKWGGRESPFTPGPLLILNMLWTLIHSCPPDSRDPVEMGRLMLWRTEDGDMEVFLKISTITDPLIEKNVGVAKKALKEGELDI